MKQNKMFSNVHHIPAFLTNACGWDWKFMTDFRGMILKRDSCVQWVRMNIKQIKHNKCTRSSSPGGVVLGLPASSRLQLHLDSSSFVFMMWRPLEGIQTLLLFPETQSVHVKSRKPEKKLRFPHHAGQIRTRVWQKQPEMMLVRISVWINRHGSVIKCPLVILYIYVLTAATVTTTGFGILEPRGRSVESEQNNSVVIIWRAYDCAVISEAVVTALFSPSASPYLHTHLLASCSLPHHRLCLHTKSSLRWRYMNSRVLKWSSGFRLLAVSPFFLKSSAGSTGWFLSRSLFQ